MLTHFSYSDILHSEIGKIQITNDAETAWAANLIKS